MHFQRRVIHVIIDKINEIAAVVDQLETDLAAKRMNNE
jgi:hypothetical protein